jgi:hypothetical protein
MSALQKRGESPSKEEKRTIIKIDIKMIKMKLKNK